MESAHLPVSDWLTHALRLAAVERRERVLVLGELPEPALLHLARACGERGRVVAFADVDASTGPHAPALERIAASGPGAGLPPGPFDLVFAAPAVPPPATSSKETGGSPSPWEPAPALFAAARSALRPGGRLVVDLPARAWSDDLWRLQPLLESLGARLPEGTNPDEVRELASRLGLRDATVTPRTCLQPLREVEDLLDLLRAALRGHSAIDFAALRLALVEIVHRRGEPPTTVLRRTSAAGRR